METIYLWVIVKGKNIPVSYEIPYSEKTQERLDNYKQEIDENGSTAIIRGVIKEDKTSVDFELYHFAQQEHLQKDSD